MISVCHIRSLIETGYLFDFSKLLAICISILSELSIKCYYSEELTLELIVSKGKDLNSSEIELFSILSNLSKLETCLDPLSVIRQIKTYENGSVVYRKTTSTRYYLKISNLFTNYPVRHHSFSFFVFSNELKLIAKVMQFLFIEKDFELIQTNTQKHIREKIVIIDSFEVKIGTVKQIKVEKLVYRRAVGFARVGSYFINFSRQLEERNFKHSVLFQSSNCSLLDSTQSLSFATLEVIINCFSKPLNNYTKCCLAVPQASKLVTGDVYKINTIQSIAPLNPANVTNHTFICTAKENVFKVQRAGKLKSVTIERSAFDNATVIGQVDRKFVLISVLISKECVLYCLDQHAVDERIRLEEIVRCYNKVECYRDISCFFSSEQLSYLDDHSAFIGKESKIEYQITDNLQLISIPTVLIYSSNTLVRCEDILSRYLNNHGFSECVLPTLASIACRSAIMFGDSLSINQCNLLINQLKLCKNPFVCAHGRPSIIPLSTFKKK
eukprot:NODE_374_length_9848_cov_0.468971.p1 type:complete len:497 gc:universal NODE_374_length_9848_cov_0.468971:8262-6772(-)